MRGLSQYDIPCRLHPAPRRVLIVGAGSGNDAAGALRHPGVESVTAVEIDPAIVALGRRHHPERPYDDPRVTVVVDDARAYFAACREQFDIICFGLLDSHTTGVLNNTRLDHYVYTRESLAQARSLLREGGVMVLSFEAARPFIADRMAGVIRQEFEQELLCFRIPPGPYGWGGVQFVAGDLQAVESSLERNPQLAGLIAGWQQRDPVPLTYQTKVLTDDWPYIYLERPGIPSPYAIVCLLMVILYWRGSRTVAQPVAVLRWSREHWHFFLLGAAFMLLEVQNISKAAVVLGSTWWVNAVIISGVLLMVLLANGIAARFPSFPLFPVYGAIWVTCAALYFIDLADFAALPFGPRAVVVGTLTTLPMLFSGVVFIRSFAASSNKREALGANMLGALVGGLLQCITFVTGIKALLIVVALLYALAFAIRGRSPGADHDLAATAEPVV
jgi:SAM-dependent methyltransferase